MVTGPDNVPVIIPHPQGVEVIVLVTTPREKLVTLQIVQVRQVLAALYCSLPNSYIQINQLQDILLINHNTLNYAFIRIIVDGSWSQWSSWSSCSVTCGVGSRTQTRMCTNPSPQGGGADCVGISIGTESCNTVACPGEPIRFKWHST